MDKLSWAKKSCGVCILWAMAAIGLPAQTFTTLHSFDVADGQYPQSALVQGANGQLYGTTYDGGASNDGTVFAITTSGTLTTLHSFDGTDGSLLISGLLQATDGNFYGATFEGGIGDYCRGGCGTLFKITPSGTLTTFHTFDYTDGSNPQGNLIQAANGIFYGTTSGGGANGFGTVFEITIPGTLTTLHSFDFYTDGSSPIGGLIQAADGNFYGTTYDGAANGDGTVFEITPNGTLTTLHTFDGTDGTFPYAGLVQATNGEFYGTTEEGGANGLGTVFKITSSGALTTLHSFDTTDGATPVAALVQATNGQFFGTTYYGGIDGDGTAFVITPSGALTTLHNFDTTDGSAPYAAVVQSTNGKLYGTTFLGGSGSACAGGCGTVFSLSVGLGPFVEPQTTSGKVGTTVKILGTNLTGATSVSFDGTAAAFTVVSSSLISANIPVGATTGAIQVKTPGGTLKSNVVFRVLP
jgi:uncharacterized repeat protein (TIGR03803 family)